MFEVRVQEVGMLEAGAREVRTGKVRFFECAFIESGIAHFYTGKTGVAELRLLKRKGKSDLIAGLKAQSEHLATHKLTIAESRTR